jgi:hypothetical protein
VPASHIWSWRESLFSMSLGNQAPNPFSPSRAHHDHAPLTWKFLIWEIPDGMLRVFDWVGAILFVPGSILMLWQVMRGPVVSVGPRGVRDRRISPAWIPWPAIVSRPPRHSASLFPRHRSAAPMR